MPKEDNSYHFICGDSSRGPIGFCAHVKAPNKSAAVERLQEFLAANSVVDLKKSSSVKGDRAAVEYCTVYIEGTRVVESDINEVEEAPALLLNPDCDPEQLYYRVLAFLNAISEVNTIPAGVDDALGELCRRIADEREE